AKEQPHTAPPTMGPAESPEIIAPDNQGESPSGTNIAPETPDPAHGSASEQSDADDVERPQLLRFTPASSGREVPAIDGYSLRLVSAHKLYDAGTLVQSAPSLAPLAPGSAVRVNPTDLERLGL